MIARRIVQLAVVISLTPGCGTGETLAPTPPRDLLLCLGAETWGKKEFRLGL
jgi:hypothetical protein